MFLKRAHLYNQNLWFHKHAINVRPVVEKLLTRLG